MHRGIARLLLFVMLVPAFGPLAQARASQPQSPHCVRRPVPPAMHCHHGMAEPQPASSAWRSADCCGANHDCCRGAVISEWARLQRAISVAPRHRIAERLAVVSGTRITVRDLLLHRSVRAPPQSSC